MSHGAKVWVALATVYVIWGSTYLGIELAGETIPPLFAVAVRFIAAAALLAGFTYWRRGARAFRMTLPEIGTAVLAGALLPGANAVLFAIVLLRAVERPSGQRLLALASVVAAGSRRTRWSST